MKIINVIQDKYKLRAFVIAVKKNLGFYNMRENSRLATQDGLCCMQSGNSLSPSKIFLSLRHVQSLKFCLLTPRSC